MGSGRLVRCVGAVLFITFMAMKIGISWIVYIIVCVERGRASVSRDDVFIFGIICLFV